MSDPLVSVIIPTYNGLTRGFLKQAIESVLRQTYAHFELILIDDGSQDDLVGGCAQLLSDVRVRLIRQQNQGLCGARKTGVEQAHGEYIAFLDDDDRFAPEKLRTQVRFFQNHGDKRTGMIFSAIRLINERGQVLGERRRQAGGDIYQRLIMEGNLVTCPSAVMVRQDALVEAGNFDTSMRSLEDFDLWLRIARCRHVYSMPEVLTDYRLHANTITAKDFTREEEYERRLYERLCREQPHLNRQIMDRNMYQRFAIRHLSLGNYAEARGNLERSLHFGWTPTSFLLWAATLLPPRWLTAGKNWRRRAKASVRI